MSTHENPSLFDKIDGHVHLPCIEDLNDIKFYVNKLLNKLFHAISNNNYSIFNV